VQRSAQAERAGPDDHDIRIHLASVQYGPRGWKITKRRWLSSDQRGPPEEEPT
jgi:hypothetical protein